MPKANTNTPAAKKTSEVLQDRITELHNLALQAKQKLDGDLSLLTAEEIVAALNQRDRAKEAITLVQRQLSQRSLMEASDGFIKQKLANEAAAEKLQREHEEKARREAEEAEREFKARTGLNSPAPTITGADQLAAMANKL
ncbi:MAG: hypothetical protein ACK4UN_05980 [Limisphaerales bacterium]